LLEIGPQIGAVGDLRTLRWSNILTKSGRRATAARFTCASDSKKEEVVMKAALFASLLFAVPSMASAQRVFDTHVHIWSGETSLRAYEAQLKETHQTATRFAGILIAERGNMAETRRKNDELIALAVKYPEMFPIASVHPYDDQDALDEVRRIARLGVTMIKLHPHTQKFAIADPRVAALCQLAGQLGMIVLFDNANIVPGDSQDLFNLAVNTPGTKFVFAHMGATNFRFWNTILFARTAKDFYKDNIYFDISATVTLVAGSPIKSEFVWTIRNIGVDHIMLGSDYPQFTLRQTVDALASLDLDRGEKDWILYETARKLLTPKVHD
jgi:predicted TIM-barrel fold metal-dependent hydrolase